MEKKIQPTKGGSPSQALASRGGETALDDTLDSISPVQTILWCLHHFAAAVLIPAVALPTGV